MLIQEGSKKIFKTPRLLGWRYAEKGMKLKTFYLDEQRSIPIAQGLARMRIWRKLEESKNNSEMTKTKIRVQW